MGLIYEQDADKWAAREAYVFCLSSCTKEQVEKCIKSQQFCESCQNVVTNAMRKQIIGLDDHIFSEEEKKIFVLDALPEKPVIPVGSKGGSITRTRERKPGKPIRRV